MLYFKEIKINCIKIKKMRHVMKHFHKLFVCFLLINRGIGLDLQPSTPLKGTKLNYLEYSSFKNSRQSPKFEITCI